MQYEDSLAALQKAHQLELEQQQAASDAAQKQARCELAELTEQAAAALASRPDRAQYIEVGVNTLCTRYLDRMHYVLTCTHESWRPARQHKHADRRCSLVVFRQR